MSNRDFTRIRYDVLDALFAFHWEGRQRPTKDDIAKRSGHTGAEVETALKGLARDGKIHPFGVDAEIVLAELEPAELQAAWDELQTYRILRAIRTLLPPGRWSVNHTTIAEHLGQAPEDVEEGLNILRGLGAVELDVTADGPTAARLTDIGLRWLRQGMPAGQPPASLSQRNEYRISGGTNVIGTSMTGDVIQYQTVPAPSNVGEIRELLAELGRHIATAEIPETKREDGLNCVELMSEELERDEIRPSKLRVPWAELQNVATLVSLGQGAAAVKETIDRLAVLLSPLLQSPPPGS
jgi:hypothetical protein